MTQISLSILLVSEFQLLSLTSGYRTLQLVRCATAECTLYLFKLLTLQWVLFCDSDFVITIMSALLEM